MPNRIKYPAEIRRQVYDLFQEGRARDSHSRGKYTGKDISKITGVEIKSVYAIGQGKG